MRGDVLALSDGRNPIAFAIINLSEQKFFGRRALLSAMYFVRSSRRKSETAVPSRVVCRIPGHEIPTNRHEKTTARGVKTNRTGRGFALALVASARRALTPPGMKRLLAANYLTTQNRDRLQTVTGH